MRFYIATGLERVADHQRVMRALHEVGHRITYSWAAHGSVQREGEARIREVALAEKAGVKEADFVVVLLPGGRGTHAELGMALAWNKPVFIQADPVCGFFSQDERTCAFYHDPLVVRVEGDDDALLRAISDYGSADANRLAGWDDGICYTGTD